MRKPAHQTLLILLFIYAAASLIHFAHNAEFLADYPNLPDSWSREGVYFVWIGLTSVGVIGWVFLSRGHQFLGLALLAVYGMGGLDSLGHYVLAPLSEHTVAMNTTILFEVAAAALVLTVVTWQMIRRLLFQRAPGT